MDGPLFVSSWQIAMQKIVPNSEIDDVSYDYGWYLDYLNGIYINDSVQSSFLHIIKEPVYDENGEFHYYIIRFDKDPVFR